LSTLPASPPQSPSKQRDLPHPTVIVDDQKPSQTAVHTAVPLTDLSEAFGDGLGVKKRKKKPV